VAFYLRDPIYNIVFRDEKCNASVGLSRLGGVWARYGAGAGDFLAVLPLCPKKEGGGYFNTLFKAGTVELMIRTRETVSWFFK
jgi:hypothetical protein